jgi:hypothetical protein
MAQTARDGHYRLSLSEPIPAARRGRFEKICHALSAWRGAIRPQATESTLDQETSMRRIVIATFTSLDGVMQAGADDW